MKKNYMLSLLCFLSCSTVSSTSILEFAIEPTSVVVREGASVILNCQTKQQTSDIYITWKKGADFIDVLPKDMKTTFSQLQNNSLYFPNVTNIDEDTYICAAVLQKTREINYSREAHITLAYIDENFISNPDRRKTVREFSRVDFSCVSGASLPPAEITWEKDGQALLNGNNYGIGQAYIKNLNATSGSLHLSNVSLSDAGYYTCVATNPLLPDMPRRSVQALLLVLPKDDKPRIEVHPVNSLSPVNRPFHMDCVIVGVPTPVIHWIKNGNNITNSSDGRRQVFLNGTLYMKSLAVNDNGLYSCAGSNDKGSVSSSDVLLRVAYLGYNFKENPQNKTVINGSAAELVCKPPDHFPVQLVFKWYKNYWSVPENGRVQIMTSGSLVLNPVLKSDEGVYFCEAKNTFSDQIRTSTEAHLTVHVPSYFHSTPSSQTVVLYDELRLLCTFGGSPPPTSSWYHGNRLLSNSSRLFIFGNTLVLPQVEASDAGTYRCVIWNIVGNQSAEANVIVHVPPNATVQPRNTSAVLGDDASFFCQFRGNPPPTLIWLFSQSQSSPSTATLTNSTRHIVLTKRQLHIVNVTAQHRGWFTCVGSNDAGLLNYTAYLEVFVPARLTKHLRNTTANESGTVQMSCEGYGHPVPTISWFKDGHPLTSGGDIILDHGTLRLKNVSKTNAGFYSCHIKNQYGNETTQAYLTVQVSPVIHSILGPPRVQWKQNVTLRCLITDGIPEPYISWSKDGDYITSSTRILKYGDVLNIIGARHQDTGNYSCKASNIVGSTQMTANLIVEVPPDPPIDLTFRNKTSTSLHVSWKPSFDGFTTILAFRVDIKHHMSSWRTVTYSVVNHEYVIEKLRPYILYTVRVFAKNKIGWSKASTESAVFTKQDSPSPPVNLSCVVSNATAIHVSWDEPTEKNGLLSQYRIAYKRYDNSSTERIVTTSKLQQVVFGLDIFTLYIFRVQASTEKNTLWGNYSTYVSCRTGEAAPAVAPENVRLISLESDKILVTWQLISRKFANGFIRQYVVQYKNTSGEHFMEMIVAGNKTTQLNITELHPWTVYVARVAAVTVHRGPWSTNGTTRTLQSAPSGPPTKITIKGHTSQSLMVSWETPSPGHRHGIITSYMVFYTRDEPGSATLNMTTNRTTVYIPGLSIFTTYILQIRAATSVGYGPLSKPSKGTTLESYPGLVSDVSHEIVNRSILITWSPPLVPNGVITTYNIRYNISISTLRYNLATNTTTVVITTSTNNVSSSVASVLLPGSPGNMTYSLCVAARTRVGYGGCSSPIVFATNFSHPPTPQPARTTPVFTPQIVNDHLPVIAGVATVTVLMVIILVACFVVNRRNRKSEEELAKRTYNFRGHAFTMSSYGDGVSSSVRSHGSKPLDGYSEDTTCSRDPTNTSNARDQSSYMVLRNSSLHLGSDASSYDDAYSSVAEIGVDPSSLERNPFPVHSAVNKLYADLHQESNADDTSSDDNSSLHSFEPNPIYAVALPRRREDDGDVPNTYNHVHPSLQPTQGTGSDSAPQNYDNQGFLYDTASLVPPPPVQFSDLDYIDDDFDMPDPPNDEDKEVTDF